MKLVLSLLLLSSTVFAQDSTAVILTKDSATNSLPKISLNTETKTYTHWNSGGFNGGMGMPTTSTVRKMYMSVENGVQNERVRGVGLNLANQVKAVPEAYKIMEQYKNGQVTSFVFMGTGGFVVLGGFMAATQSSGDKPNLGGLVAGAIIMGLSNIPHWIVMRHPQKAVDTYNSHRE